jgi:hypothetical protein
LTAASLSAALLTTSPASATPLGAAADIALPLDRLRRSGGGLLGRPRRRRSPAADRMGPVMFAIGITRIAHPGR